MIESVNITRLILTTMHPEGMCIQRSITIEKLCKNCGECHMHTSYSIGLAKMDTAAHLFLRQRGILEQEDYTKLTKKGLVWIEITLREFGGKPSEIFNTGC